MNAAGRSLSVTSPSLAPYLRAAAAALVEPGATVESVLRTARARDVDSGDNYANFRAPDPRFRFAAVYSRSSLDHALKSVLFVCHEDGPPVTLAELEAAFGTWKPGPSGSAVTDVHVVLFDAPYPPAAVAAPRPRIATVVRVSLTAEPDQPGARVREILLSRFHLDGG